jgi:UDP-glucuronate decarboxylase
MMNQDSFSGPVNLGNSDEFTVKELAELVIKLTKSKSKIIYNPLPQDDPARRRPDLTLAKEKLGYKFTVPLVEGLKRTIKYFQGEIKK